MEIAVILGYVLQLVQAGFELSAIVAKVREMQAAGSSDKDIHDYLKQLAHDNQTALENA